MALIQSNDLPLGSVAPDFDLLATRGERVSLNDFRGHKGLVVMFICNHCPYVIHISGALAELARQYQSKGVAFVAINSNDADAYPDDSFDKMVLEVDKRGYPFPYLYDESQDVARAYRAACTPDIYLFDSANRLVYHGQFDETRPHRIASGHYDSSAQPAHGRDLRTAMDAVLQGKALSAPVYPAMGCNIKWRS